MVQINIHGREGKGSAPGGQAPGGLGVTLPKGPRSTILPDIPVELSDNPQRATDYAQAQAQANQQNPYGDDYTKALRQRTAQVNAQTAGVLKKRRQEAAMWRTHDQQEVKDQRTLDQITKDEIREREKHLVDEKKENARLDRIKAKDQQAQDRLDRSNQIIHNRQIGQERGLQNQFRNLGNKANWHLTPTGFRSLSQSLENFDEKVGHFRSAHHRMPYYGGSTADMRAGMGTLEGSYHVANTMRMGSAGQRFAFEGNYTELVRIERELKRIENLTDKKLRFDQSPAAQANLERQKNALLHAKTQIRTGLEGHGRLYNAVGHGYGRVMNTFRDPVMRTVLDAVTATVGAPYAANRMLSGVIGMQSPYLNWDIAAHQIARGGGFKPLGMQESLLNMGKGGFVPGKGLGPMAQEFGLNPKDVFNQILNQYGVPVRNNQEAARVAASVRQAYLAPGVQLPENQMFSMLGGATSTGIVSPNQKGSDTYFRQLQKTMALATREGVNQSRMAQGWTNLIQQSARSGLGTNLESMSRFFRSLAASGAPGAREGQLQSDIFAGTQQAIQGIGVTGNNGMNIAVMSALRGHMPKSEAQLTRTFGIKFDKNNPAQQQALKNYLAAANQNSPFALEMLQPLLSGQSPDVLKKFLEKSPLIRGLPAGAREVAMANLLGTNVTGLTAWQAAQSGAGSAAMSGVAPMVPQDLKQLVNAKASQSGMSNADLQALVMTESGGRPGAISKAGAIGMTQVMPGTIAEYNKAKGTTWTPQDALRNASINMDIGTWYYQQMLQKAGGDPVLAYGLYNAGPGRMNDILSGHAPAETQKAMGTYANYLSQYSGSNEALKDFQRIATGGAADLQGSRYVTEVSDKVVAAFTNAAGAVDGLAQAATRASTALSNMFTHGTQSVGSMLSSNPAGNPSHLMDAYSQYGMGGLYKAQPVK